MRYKTRICRQLRKEMTPSEQLLWSRLRRKQTGFKFRRQHPIGPYIADFYCHAARLIVEVDGSIHNRDDVKGQDRFRDDFCAELDYKILRIKNSDIMTDLDSVLELIVRVCDSCVSYSPP